MLVRPAAAIVGALVAAVIYPSGGLAQSTATAPPTSTAKTGPTTTVGASTPDANAAQSSAPARLPGDCLAAGSGSVPSSGDPVDPPIKLQAVPQATVRNFGSGRTPVDSVFRLTVEKALPASIEKHLQLVADPIVRVGETTDSASFPEPIFSALTISQNRRTVRFRVCLTPSSNLPAGKYVGTINLEGPPGFESDTMTVTANAKDGRIFKGAAVLSLIAAFVILLFKGTNDTLTARKEDAEKETDPPRTAQVKAAELETAANFSSAVRGTLGDPKWLIPTVLVVVGAFGALWALYDANPAWGEAGPVTSAIAVISAVLSAIGAKEILTTNYR